MTTLKFTVDSALLRELGEKLVETVHIALVELVKNCYDADATQVDIVFTKNNKGKDEIRISDNGIGMSFDAVKNYWMRIATTNKNKSQYSTVFGRPLTGAKGIGRFSCRRLGGHLKLISLGTANGKHVGAQKIIQRTEVEFPWLDFEPGTDVTYISCKGEQVEVKNQLTGTTLIITHISEEWSAGGFSWLKRQLAVLSANRGTKRKGFQEDLGFNVSLKTDDSKEDIKDLRELLINAGWGTLNAHINKRGQAVCELQAMGIGTRNIISTQIFPSLYDVSLKLAIMVDDSKEMRNKKVLSKSTLREILNDWGGVQVRYKGFRVYPYGNDDWLDIDYERSLRRAKPRNELFLFAQSLKGVNPARAMLNMLSMKSYVGNVEIGEMANGFEMKASREGFIASAPVAELKDFTRFAIDWSIILRDFYLREKTQKVADKAQTDFEEVIGKEVEHGQVIEAAVEYLETEIKTISNNMPISDRQVVERSFYKATDTIRKKTISNQAELSHLRLIASTSTLLLIFSHEVKTLLGLLEQSKTSLEILAESLTLKQKKEISGITKNFDDFNSRLEELLEMTSLIRANSKKSKPGQVALRSKIIKVEKIFDLIIKKYKIELDYKSVPTNLVIKKILEAEIYSILLNVLSNSIKAVIAGGSLRRIQIAAKRENNQNIITIRDTGIGMKESNYKEVFVPFIADPEGKLYRSLERRINPEDSMIIGDGSGLGLGIVKEIVEAHGGEIYFKKPSKEWKSELEIKMP